MKCPHCAAESTESAADCPACGLVFAKWRERKEKEASAAAENAAKLAASAAEITRQRDQESRFAADPALKQARFAVFIFWILPLTSLILWALAKMEVDLNPEALRANFGASAWAIVISMVLASRVKQAPLIASVLCAALFLTHYLLAAPAIPAEAGEFAGELQTQSSHGMGPLLYICLGGLGLAWYARSQFFRDFEAAKMPGWILRGLWDLKARDSYAIFRLALGALILLGVPFAFFYLEPELLKNLSRADKRACAGILTFGGLIFASGLSFVDLDELKK